MSKQKNVVDRASDDSFPASDPPSWTPVTGTGDPHSLRKVLAVGDEVVVHVENGRGEELRKHLGSHGIRCRVSTAAETHFERVEVESAEDPEVLQTLIDEWEG